MSAELLDRIHLAVVDDYFVSDFSAYRDEWFFISSVPSVIEIFLVAEEALQYVISGQTGLITVAG
jgi:hypothetical protein